jgi:hypothetical protein
MVPLRDVGNVAVFVNCITAKAVWATPRLPQDDLGKFFMGFGWPASLCSQFWEPRNVAMGKFDFGLFILRLDFFQFLVWPWSNWRHGGRWHLGHNGRLYLCRDLHAKCEKGKG